jgi:probable rRNA maturation factor
MNVVIANRQRVKKINTHQLKKMVAAIFVELKIETAELGIHLVGAKEMAKVNWQFLQHEGSTDVITFDHAEKRKPKSKKQIHGELFICIEDAISQAKEFQTSWQSETARYIVHGILHLLGYDDLKPNLRREMKREENRLMRLLAKKFALAQIAASPRISS